MSYMEIKAIDFPYTNDITCVSKKQFDVHKTLYNGYVSKTNEIFGILKDEKNKTGNASYSEYRGLKKGLSYTLDGIILHELYFGNLGARGKRGESFDEMLCKHFSNYEGFVKDFKACAMSARGWAILSYEQRSERLVNMLLDSHDNGVITGAFPLIVLDMYEHAYYIDYANNKEEYFVRFMGNINWESVCARFDMIS